MDGNGTNPWLVIGHGSVGSFLAGRLARGGISVAVLDPAPRVPVAPGTARITALPADGAFAHAISCVTPAAAEAAAQTALAALAPGGLLLDWNTVAPSVKRRIGTLLPSAAVDVALLDSLDGAAEHPTLAVSGVEADRAAALLRRLGFAVSVAGGDVGDAASLKYLRSIFMKTLEALVLEFSTLASTIDDAGIVRDSIERNLGATFGSFMDLLVTTNRLHAGRRSAELADAVATFVAEGTRPELAEAAVAVLRRAAVVWADSDAPADDAEPSELTSHLRRALWPEPAST
jgi:3-hydroxyisobutyrate dehydrogenase-like beta-hydroxyacid dehydrogenase